jgi:minor extracellular serine protease Vpr
MKVMRLQALCALLSVVVLAPVFAQDPVAPLEQAPAPEVSATANETPQLWFVELASPPTADGTSPAQVASEQAAFRSAARSAGLNYRERYVYQSLFNGFSVKVAPSDVAKLTRIQGVKNVYPVGTVQLHAAAADTPDQQDWLSMTGADTAQNVLGVHGDGITVAVMDTGIDYLHPDLGGCFGPGCRVEKGYDLVGDAYDAGTNDNPRPDPDPMDCNGHGTHVSGIVGADGHGQAGHVTGVAPHVKFHAYRVFGCNGSTTDDVMLAAMEMILADGADVLNMSIGSAFEDWAESPTAAGSDRLVRKGIVVVASAGNSGANGTYSTGAPSTGKKVISVASFENLTVKQQSFTISPDNRPIGYIPAAGAPNPPTSGTSPIKAAPDTIGCATPAAGTYTGFVALIKRGTCSFYAKAFAAQAAGASAVVLYNNAAGFLNATVAGSPPITIPVVAITLSDGNLIASRLAGGAVTMTWTNQLISVANPFAGLVSTFSSLGPSAELDFKPDVGAPGGNIYSTYPLAQGGYATLSGTSMASPHVAGSVALLLQAKPHTPPPLTRDLLQNNAVPTVWNGSPGLGFLDNVHVQGAGLIHIDRTVTTDAQISPAKLALGEGAAGPVTQTLTLQNNGGAAKTFALSHVGALATGPNEFLVPSSNEFDYFAAASFSAPSVNVPAGGSATVDVTITAPAVASNYVYGGYIVATPSGGGNPLRVPYMGVTGNYQDVKVLGTAGAAGLPLLARVTGGTTITPVGNGAVFTMADADHIPYILYQLAHAARTLKAEVFSAQAGGTLGKAWHSAFQFSYLPRNTASTNFFAQGLDGSTTNGHFEYTLPNGNYVVVMSALKPLGDSNNPADWETWQSPMFTIARP